MGEHRVPKMSQHGVPKRVITKYLRGGEHSVPKGG